MVRGYGFVGKVKIQFLLVIILLSFGSLKAQNFKVNATDTSNLGTPVILVSWTVVNPSMFSRYEVSRNDTIIFITTNVYQLYYPDYYVKDGQVARYCVKAYNTYGIVTNSDCDSGFTYSYSNLLNASDSRSDAYVDINWKIPYGCLTQSGGKPVFVQLMDRTANKEIYTKKINGLLYQPYDKGNFRQFLDSNMQHSYELNLYKIGPGTSLCNGLFKDSGKTKPFQPPLIWTTHASPNSIGIYWHNQSDLASKIRVYRNGKIISILDSTETEFHDDYKFNDTSSIVNAKSYEYCLEVYNTRLNKAYPKVCVRDTTIPINFTATDNAFPDKVYLKWNDIEKYVSKFKVLRDGKIIATLPGSASTYTDKYPVFGKQHQYGLRLTQNDTDLIEIFDSGGVKANGYVSGRVTTLNGNFAVAGVKITAQFIENTDTFLRITNTDITGFYEFHDFYYGTGGSISLIGELPGDSFQKNPVTVSLNPSKVEVENADFKALKMISVQGNATLSFSNMQFLPDSQQDYLEIKWNYSTSKKPVWFQIFRDNKLIDILNDHGKTLSSYIDKTGQPGAIHTYVVNAYVIKNSKITLKSLTKKVKYPEVARVDTVNMKVLADAGKGLVHLSWSHTSHNFNGYKIYRDSTEIADLPAADTVDYYDLTGEAGKIFDYAIAPYIDRGNQYFEAKWAFAAPVQYPDLVRPSTVSVSIDTQTNRVLGSWQYARNTGYNYDGFKVVRVAGTKFDTIARINKFFPYSFIDETGTPGVNYRYDVYAYKAKNFSLSSKRSATIQFPDVRPADSISASNLTYVGYIKVNIFNRVSNIDGMVLITGSDTAWLSAGTKIYDYIFSPPYSYTSQSFTLENYRVIDGKKYFSSSVDDSGKLGKDNGNGLQDPTNFSASDDCSNHIRMSWSYPVYILPEFHIFRNNVLIAKLSSDQRVYYDYQAQPSVDYVYQIEAQYQNSYSNRIGDHGKLHNYKVLSGTATTLQGIGIIGVKIKAELELGGQKEIFNAITDSAGYYRISGIPNVSNGLMTICAEKANHKWKQDTAFITLNNQIDKFNADFVDTFNNYKISSNDITAISYIQAIPDELNNTVEIHWNVNSGNFSGFKVYRGLSEIVTIPKGDNMVAIDDGGYPGILYFYRVKAYWDLPEGRKESEFRGTSALYPGVPPITDLQVQPDAEKDLMYIEWSHPSNNVSFYEVTRDSLVIGKVMPTSQMIFIDISGLPDQQYTYSVKAVRQIGNRTFNSTDVSKRGTFPIIAPVDSLNAQKVSGDNAILLTWVYHSGNFSGYRIYRDRQLIDVIRTTVPVLSYVDYTGHPGTTHTYAIAPYDMRQGMVYEAPLVKVIIKYPSIIPVTNLTATPVDSMDFVRLTWNYTPKANTGFKIYSGSKLIATVTDSSLRSYDDPTGIPGSNIKYSVSAYAIRGTLFESAKTSVSTTFPIVASPMNLTASDGTLPSVKLTWDHPSKYNQGFIIYRDNVVIDTVMNPGKRFYDDVINDMTKSLKIYHYRLKAFRIVGTTWYLSAYSNSDDGSFNNGSFSLLTDTTLNNNAKLGASVDMDGDYAIAGAPQSDEKGTYSGSAYIYKKGSDNQWHFYQKLLAGDASGSDFFGKAVAIKGNTIVVGAPYKGNGAAYVFEKDSSGMWVQKAKLIASGNHTSTSDRFGAAVDVDKDIIVVGAPNFDTTISNVKFRLIGSVYIFQKKNNNWNKNNVTRWLPSYLTYVWEIGLSVRLSGNTLVVGSSNIYIYGIPPPLKGRFYIIKLSGKAVSSYKTNYTTYVPAFNTSATIKSNTILVSSPGKAISPDDSGMVSIYKDINGTWSMTSSLKASDYGHQFNSAFDGNQMIVGLSSGGGVYQFDYDGSSWVETQKFQVSNSTASFGLAIELQNGIAMVSDQGSTSQKGWVYFVQITQPPKMVLASDGTSNKTRIDWSHDDANALNKFNIYRDGILIASQNPNQTFYYDTDGKPGKKYVYSVSAVSKNGGESGKLSDIGYSRADGTIKGSVITLNGAIGVPGVNVSATAMVEGEQHTYNTTTNYNGDFQFNSVYYGDSANYLVKASYPYHSFVQDTTSVLLQTNTNQGAVKPFIDKTSFIIKGKLARTMVMCGLDSIKVKLHSTISGQSTTKEVYTDKDGVYSFVYNPLDPNLDSIVIEPEPFRVKNNAGLDTSVLKFSPARVSYNNFSSPDLLTIQNFTEVTTYPVKLQVKNTCGPLNGTNYFYINIHTSNDCFNKTVKTDGFGKLTLNLPPLDYIMTVQDVEPVNLNNLPVLKYLQVRPEEYDLKKIHDNNRIAQLPNDSLDLNVNFVFHKVPFITVSGINNYMCNDPKKPAVMSQGDSVELSFNVLENHSGSNCPVSEGFLVIKNGAATVKNARVDFDKDTYSFQAYKFIVGDPNLVFPYIQYLIVEYHTKAGGYQGELIKSILVEGTKATPGNDIIVETGKNQAGQVQLPLYVLRNPPGDGSYSYIEKGTKFSRTIHTSNQHSSFASVKSEGVNVFFGIGVKYGATVTAGGGGGNAGDITVTAETKERISTSASSNIQNKNLTGWLVGNSADVIVGMGMAQQYGIAQRIYVDPDSCRVINQYLISTAPSKIQTTWIYTVDQIQGLIEEYDSDLVKLQDSTAFKIEGKTNAQAIDYIRTLKYNWGQILKYYQTTTVPYYNLCDLENYDDLPEPFRSQVKDWVTNGFCTDIGTYSVVNGKKVFEVNSDLVWSSTLLEKYNKLNQVVRDLSDSKYQWSHPGGQKWTGSSDLDNVNLDQDYSAQYGPDAENITFSGGSSYSKSVGVSKASSRSYNQQWSIGASAFAHLFNKVKVTQSYGTALGAFFAISNEAIDVTLEGGLDAGYKYTWQRDETKKIDTSTTVGYVLSDDDPGDQYSVTIIRGIDPAFSPYFALLGGRTSCPSEPGAINRDIPQISLETPDGVGFNSHQRNLDPDKPAIYPLKLSNLNKFGEDRWYQLYSASNSNQYGAKLSVGGTALGTKNFLIPAGGSIYANLEITRSPNYYQHLDLAIGLRAQCDGYVSDEIKLQAEWQSPCSQISILTDNNWSINKADSGKQEQLIIELGDYDLNNAKFEYAEVQYRREGTNNWMTLIQIPKDTLIAYYDRWKTNPPLPPNYYVIWNITGNNSIFDGAYEIRALAKCGIYGNIYSNTITGTIDRSSIRLFGNPQPSDGLLSLGDEISVTFNKKIDCARMMNSFFTFLKKSDSSEVKMTWSCNDNKIIFTPVDSMAKLDGITILASLDSTYDLFDNMLLKSVKWEFEVSNNPIYWNPDSLNVNIYRGDKDTFKAYLLNTGVGNHNFNLSNNSPTWLHTNILSGSVPPVGKLIKVIVDASTLALGTHRDTVAASITGFNEEKLPVTVTVFPTPPSWNVNPAKYSNSINIVANFKINNGPISTDSLDRIAVAIGANIRGVANIMRFGTTHWVAYLTVYGNTADIGKNLDFRVWDASAGVEYDASLSNTISFSGDNAIYGTIIGPEILNIRSNRDSARYIPLNEGWTWFSLNTHPNSMGVNNLLRSISPTSGDQLKTLNTSSEYLSGKGWISLNGLDSFTTDTGYLIHLAHADTLRLSGKDAKVNLLSLPEGWSLIGFPQQRPYNLDSIWFAQPKAGDGDILKSQTQTAIYDSVNSDWQGSLQTFQPNQAYMLKLGHATTVDFHNKKGMDDPSQWKVNGHSYEYNMVITGMLEINNLPSIDISDRVAAFIDGQCRGSAHLQFVNSLGRYLLTLFVYSNNVSGDNVTFKIYKASQNMVFNAVDTVIFNSDSIIGSLSGPYFFRNTFSTGIKVLAKDSLWFDAFPNPFHSRVNIAFEDNKEQEYQIQIIDALGREAYQNKFRSVRGENKLNLKLKDKNLKAGVYFIRLENDENVKIMKIMKL